MDVTQDTDSHSMRDTPQQRIERPFNSSAPPGCIAGRSGVSLPLSAQLNALWQTCNKLRVPASHVRVGRRGERLARRYLKRRGMRILHTNWRLNRGELDIVAQERRTLVIIEVKTLSHRADALWLPEDHLTARKIHRLKRLGRAYCRREVTNILRSRIRWIRYDAVVIRLPKRPWLFAPEIRHLRGLRSE